MTCRDRNSTPPRPSVGPLRRGAAITGDPIPIAERDEVKNVYQFNSRKLAQYIVSLAGDGDASAMTVFVR